MTSSLKMFEHGFGFLDGSKDFVRYNFFDCIIDVQLFLLTPLAL